MKEADFADMSVETVLSLYEPAQELMNYYRISNKKSVKYGRPGQKRDALKDLFRAQREFDTALRKHGMKPPVAHVHRIQLAATIISGS